MDIKNTVIPLLAHGENWHIANMRYGEYVAFDGSDLFATIVAGICRDPNSHCIGKEFDEDQVEIISSFRNLSKSYRTSTNGLNYDWYIRYFHLNKNQYDSFSSIHKRIFVLAKVIEALIEEGLFDVHEILKNIPRINKDYKIEYDEEAIEIIKIQKDEERTADRNEIKSTRDELNEFKSFITEMMKKAGGNDQEYKQLVKANEDTIKQLEKRIDTLQDKIDHTYEEKSVIEGRLVEASITIGSLKSQISERGESVLMVFKVLFPKFTLLSENTFLSDVINSRDQHLYINALKVIYKKLVDDKCSIEDLGGCFKLTNTRTWYRFTLSKKEERSGFSKADAYTDWTWAGGIDFIEQTLENSFYISIFEEYGNQKIYLHFGKLNVETLLESHDPPRAEKNTGI